MLLDNYGHGANGDREEQREQMPRTRMAQSPPTAEWMINPQHEEQPKSNQPQQQQHPQLLEQRQLGQQPQQQQLELEPAETHVFLGEESRACFRHLHIVNAARLILFADLARLALETAYFVAHIGYIDAACFLQICWAIVGTAMAMPALCRRNRGERYYRYLWPLLALKITECLVCLFVLLLIFILGVSGPLGYGALRLLIQWKYRRIEDDDAIAFSLGTFLIVSLLLVMNCYILHIYFWLKNYLHAKATYLYLQQRNLAIRAIRPSFFMILSRHWREYF